MKGFLYVIIILALFINLVTGEVNSCQEEIEEKTAVELTVDDLILQELSDGVINIVTFSFENTGSETVTDVSFDIMLYDDNDKAFDVVSFRYDSSLDGYKPLQKGEKTTVYRQGLYSEEGTVAVRFRVINLRVNGYAKDSGYEY